MKKGLVMRNGLLSVASIYKIMSFRNVKHSVKVMYDPRIVDNMKLLEDNDR